MALKFKQFLEFVEFLGFVGFLELYTTNGYKRPFCYSNCYSNPFTSCHSERSEESYSPFRVNSVSNLKARIKIFPGACPERTDRFLAEFILSKKTGFLTLFGMTGEGLEMTNRFHLWPCAV
jgi:hypothetical protein